MTNLERKIIASRGYKHPFDNNVSFSTWESKPKELPPEGYEYVPYETKYGSRRWKLQKIRNSEELIKEHGPEALKNLLSAGVKPGTKANLVSNLANQVIDSVTELR